MTYGTYSSEPTMKDLLNRSNYYREYKKGETIFNKKEVFVTEKIKGSTVKIAYDGNKINASLNEKTDDKEFIEFINLNYIKKYSKLMNIVGRVPFVLFGTFIEPNSIEGKRYGCKLNVPKIVFNDIYINKNWMCYDHIKEIMSLVGLDYSPILYIGNFNSKTTKLLANGSSSYSKIKDTPIEGVIIRSLYEDTDSKYLRMARSITNSIFVPRVPAVVNKEVRDEIVEKKAREILKTYINSTVVEEWKKRINDNKISIDKANIHKIMIILVNYSLKKLKNEIEASGLLWHIRKKTLIKKIKKLLPTLIRNNLKF